MPLPIYRRLYRFKYPFKKFTGNIKDSSILVVNEDNIWIRYILIEMTSWIKDKFDFSPNTKYKYERNIIILVLNSTILVQVL